MSSWPRSLPSGPRRPHDWLYVRLHVDVRVQADRLDAHTGRLQGALEQAPEVLQVVGVDVDLDLPVVLSMTRGRGYREPVSASVRISVWASTCCRIDEHHVLGAHGRRHLSTTRPMLPAKMTNDRSLSDDRHGRSAPRASSSVQTPHGASPRRAASTVDTRRGRNRPRLRPSPVYRWHGIESTAMTTGGAKPSGSQRSPGR